MIKTPDRFSCTITTETGYNNQPLKHNLLQPLRQNLRKQHLLMPEKFLMTKPNLGKRLIYLLKV